MSDNDASTDWRYLPPRPLGSIGPEEYIRERMFEYRKWYDNSAQKAKTRYQGMRGVSVVGAAIVPVLVNLDFQYLPAVTTVISLLVVVLVSLESVYHYGDQWKNYRSTEQFIAHGSYKGLKPDRAFLHLVERIEGAISTENASTLNVLAVASQAKAKQEEKDDTAAD
jgi:hypothetical protein